MPISGGKYVSPTWVNNASPAIDAAELQALTDTVAVNGEQTRPKQFYNLVASLPGQSPPLATDEIPIINKNSGKASQVLVSSLLGYIRGQLPYTTVQTGSYVGTGTYGVGTDPKSGISIQFQHHPKFVVLFPVTPAPASGTSNHSKASSFQRRHLAWFPGVEMYNTLETGISTTYDYQIVYLQYDSSTKRLWWNIRVGNGGAETQMNKSGQTYAWVAICERT